MARYPWLWRNGVGIHYAYRDAPHEPLVDKDEVNLLENATAIGDRSAKIIHYHYVRGWKAERHLQSTAEEIKKDAERLRKGEEPNVARVPWAQ